MALLDGRTGLVTGAAQGIGRASAMACAAEGAHVLVSDLSSSEEGGRETVRLITAAGGSAAWHPCDVRSAQDQAALVQAAVAHAGRLDFAHNNAGIVIEGLVTEIEESDFDAVLAVNLKGVLLGMRYQLRQMLQQGAGAIVNTSSLAGLIAAPAAASYVASKHAVVGLTKTAALEVAEQGIRVNAICPAGVATPMLLAQPQDRLELLMAPQAIKRLADPAEIGNVVAWLCSDRASFITGHALPVDAGALAG